MSSADSVLLERLLTSALANGLTAEDLWEKASVYEDDDIVSDILASVAQWLDGDVDILDEIE